MKKLLVLVGLLTSSYGCGKFPIETRHTMRVEGEAEIRHVVDVRLDICEDLPLADKVECVKDVLAVLEAALNAEQIQTIGGEQP